MAIGIGGESVSGLAAAAMAAGGGYRRNGGVAGG